MNVPKRKKKRKVARTVSPERYFTFTVLQTMTFILNYKQNILLRREKNAHTHSISVSISIRRKNGQHFRERHYFSLGCRTISIKW